ncbi:elongation factor P maturation arginine rhamnosyltransferase EarP [Ideonella sp. BN130291]|uniref:elongation factor P maturation arginine rhamnosyltransferase EarP n=1 Tax=Ideonella sp. BN130291 TaxID=3112940 RepID=UPI002E25F052|nr:elongation factor P maturation arginine rhamnosyltransferase EarP [Ideonella sp. BN130291]
MRWDLFCRVIDNYGDIGVCWRLAADLGARGETVRLWVDDPSALAWMAPQGAAGVELVNWTAEPPGLVPGEVVVEAFGCDPPAAFVARMALQRPPVWVNLEYLSAEDYVERSHGLPSPQRNGLTKWFFYPGFTRRTGGLLREPGLMAAQAAFDRTAWLHEHGIHPTAGERLVSVFCYDDPALPQLLQALGQEPTLVLLAPGAAQRGAAGMPALTGVRMQALPWLTQADFDRLLWSCDVNFVRGEDSFVRAQWAGAPFVWHIYPQRDGAHAAKLEAFIDHLQPDAAVRQLWHAWNGLAPWPAKLPAVQDWASVCLAWRDTLLAQPDLATQLLSFVQQKG